MENRRDLHSFTIMYKILNNLAPNYLADMFTLQNEVHSANTRDSRKNLFQVLCAYSI